MSYEILDHLGSGQHGRTTLARIVAPADVPTSVVIKQVYTPPAPPAPLDVLTQRLRSLSRHPQLPSLLDSWQTPQGQFFAFEHIVAPPITQTESPPWAPPQVAVWLLSLLPVLEHIHSFRLVHGDIRPANIRCAQGPSILVDLRITQGLGIQPAAVTIGDAAYAAPEQALGQLVSASDLYSLGLVAIHLLTGLAPFDLYSIADHRWIWPDLVTAPVPKNLSQVLHKLLEPSLTHRYTSAAQAITELKKSPTLLLLDKARSLLPLKASLPLPSLSPTSSLAPPATQLRWQPLYHLPLGTTTALALQGKILALGTCSGTVLIFDLATGGDVYSLKGQSHRDRITALAFHPQAPMLYSASSDGTVKQWDLTGGALVHTVSQPGWQPTDLAIAPPYLIVSDGTGHMALWNLAQLTPDHCFTQHQDWVSAIAARGQRLVSISRDRTLRLWSLSDKRLLDTWPIGQSRALALHPSGNYVIVGNDQGAVDVWSVEKLSMAEAIKPERLCTEPDGVTALALSPDARLLAVGTDGNALRIYQGASGQCISALAQGWGVIEIAFDGHTLVSSSQDETVTIWQRVADSLP